MEAFVIVKSKVPQLIDSLIKDNYTVISPKKTLNDIIFDELQSGSEFVDAHTLVGPKEFLYPQFETLFSYSTKGTVKVDVKKEYRKQVIFGYRSCDLRGMLRLEDTFNIDPYYMKRKENTIIINFSCTEPCEHGFCKSLGGPTADSGFDLQFTDIGDCYFVDVGSEKGQKLVDDYIQYFYDATDEHVAMKKERIEDVIKKLPDIPVPGIHEEIKWDDPIIKDFADRCIMCGGCNFVCPSCFCYNASEIYDDESQTGERIRDWDSCLLPGFTRVAGGENIRKEDTARMRQRLYHKFAYHFIVYGAYHCTGCGRCYNVCPVGIDLREFVLHVRGIAK